MLVPNALKMIDAVPDRWVRVSEVRKVAGGVELIFTIHKGRRGKRIAEWSVNCRGVHETQITDFDGGGLRLYSTTHPAARQYAVRWAVLRWPMTCDKAQVVFALHRAHARAVAGWIPFDRYLEIDAPWTQSKASGTGTPFQPFFAPTSGRNFVCRGPDFLVRAYANALRELGERVQLTFRRAPKAKPIHPKVLHFGGSYVVANTFSAEQIAIASD